ncbi:PAC2 family protein [Corynebacterium anserum]|uniref:PAC2 family protein n=1 Tax=Corynebacterium anserum TaxID=2684406 RepID=A0A7G7YNP4_9CORY|nr:PAC2 family protein [Corynebacterium anserum]MBC2681697.1 PAC2 family protein [Corynebacterium anserum]QNH96114.1 PAC2 family protein [Corynebacterium anserum]
MTNNDRPSNDRTYSPKPRRNAMYELEYPTPMRSEESVEPLPMLVALQGYADAGQAIANASTHLLQALDHSPVASFKVDELIDYRSRRPGVTINHSRVVHRENMELTLYLLKDISDRPFLLLSGPEPDLKWEAFSDAVVELAQRTGVERVVTLYSAPMTVPHTRPLVISAHASDNALIKDFHTWDSRMIIPGAAALDTEYKLDKHGIETIGMTAHVPHYIAASDYPEATYALLKAAGTLTGLDIPLGALESDIDRIKRQLEEQVSESQEISAVVAALERQYDAEAEQMRRRKENNLLEPGQQIPTGEELGAEFEAFLADLSKVDSSEDAINLSDEQTDRQPQNDRPADPQSQENHPGDYSREDGEQTHHGKSNDADDATDGQ